jgi:hypothetical protein
VRPGNLVHFVDCKKTQYDTLGMIIGFMSPHRSGRGHRGLFRVKWYDDPSCGVEDYDEEDLELVSEDWRLS